MPGVYKRRMALLIPMLLSAFAMTGIVAVRYLAASGAFALLTRWRRPALYKGLDRQIRREIRWSLLSTLIYGVPAGIVAWGWQSHGWTRIYTGINDWPVWYWPFSILLYLLAHDAWFYWTHRAMHDPLLFRIAHAVHHESRPPTAWAAMSFHPLEAITGAIVIPALVLFIPVHVTALAVILSIMTVMGISNHMGWDMFPRAMVRGRLGHWFITASHHQRHHELYGCNFGLYFRFWDHFCGTDRGLGDFAPANRQENRR